jgi:murein DD-endopeptidase MepM/ murein hydrolase activator NlpD
MDSLHGKTTLDGNASDAAVASITLDPYTIAEFRDEQYQDSNVLNTVEVAFKAIGADGTVVTDKASSGEAVCFGKCPQSLSCWPTTGTVNQLPWGSYSHSKVDAFDIAAILGTPIISPHAGQACWQPFDGRIYGEYVTVSVPNETGTDTYLFAHMIRGSPGDALNLSQPGQCTPINAGQLLGLVDSTGRSDGNHLHYELRNSAIGQSRLYDRVPGGRSVQLGQSVRSMCQP